MNIYNLKCLGQDKPINVYDRLYFSWSLKNCSKQLSYKVEIFENKNCIYSITKKSQCQQHEIKKLPKFQPLTEYFWQVTIKADSFEETSNLSSFITVSKDFYGAKWISGGSRFVEDNGIVGSPSIYLKKTILLNEKSYPAILKICGLGLFELTINKKKVGDCVLEPPFTAYDKSSIISVFEVSNYLELGRNDIEIILGDGWYNQTTHDTWGFYRAPWRDSAKAIMALSINGNNYITDDSWEYSLGEIVSSAIRCGEKVDFTKRREYKKASIVAPCGGDLKFTNMPSIKENEVLTPIASYPGKIGIIYDFGKNISGYVGVRFKGEKGAKIKIIYSDRINNGECDNTSNSMYIFNKDIEYQTDSVIISGEGSFKPKFTYHGFRYAEIIYDKAKCELLDVKAYFIYTGFEKIGNFLCSDKLANTLCSMSVNAIKSNYVGFPTDCPHREKNGWTGDAQLSLESATYTFNMSESYYKWLLDFIDCQRQSGQISAIIPTSGWGYNWGSGPAWDIAFFRICDCLLNFYSLNQSFVKFYPYLKLYYNYISEYVKDGLLSVGLGDWNYPKNIDFLKCPTELTDSCYYLLMCKYMYSFALKFDKSNASTFLDNSIKVKNAIFSKYAGKEKSLTGMSALSYFSISNEIDSIIEYLEKNDYKLHCGILGTKLLLNVLGENGKVEEGYKILSQKEYPSFGYWVENGQTSLCEDFELTNSLNHHIYSSILEFYIKYVCGLRIKNLSNITIKPFLPTSMNFASYTLNTAYGELSIKITREDSLTCEVVVPSNVKVKYQNKNKNIYLKVGKNLLKNL